MESLIGYGSDDEIDDLPQRKSQHSSEADVNYEEVQMDLSEESSDSTKLDNRRHSQDDNRLKYNRTQRSDDGDKHQYNKKPQVENKSSYDRESRSPKNPDRHRDRERDRNKNDGERRRSKDERGKEDGRGRDHKRDRYRERDDKSRNKERESRKGREEQEQSNRDRGNSSREINRDDSRRTHRTSSREKHRSRSPKKNEQNKRSNSRERERNYSGYSKRFDRATNKMDRLEKLGIEFNSLSSTAAGASNNFATGGNQVQDKNRFFMPGITGRFSDQIQRRKMLWQKKEPSGMPKVEATTSISTVPPATTKLWSNTTFAQDTDGKVANKFKRLMGIKGNEDKSAKPSDTLKKQEEMFNSMEAQYEVARTATHTMRGVGLGFGSFQR